MSRHALSPIAAALSVEPTMSVNMTVARTLSGTAGASLACDESLDFVDDVRREEDVEIVVSRDPHRPCTRDPRGDLQRLALEGLAVEDECRYSNRRQHFSQIGFGERPVQRVSHFRARADSKRVGKPAPVVLVRSKRGAPRLEERVGELPCAPALTELAQFRERLFVAAFRLPLRVEEKKRARPLGVAGSEKTRHPASLLGCENDSAGRPNGIQHSAQILHARLETRELAAMIGDADSPLVEEDQPKRAREPFVEVTPARVLPVVAEVRAAVE